MKDKLMSRKFWMAAIAVMVVGLGLFGFDTDDVKSVVEIASGMAVMLGYVLSEASIDKAALNLTCEDETESGKRDSAEPDAKEDSNDPG
jgi:hypothetical protein